MRIPVSILLIITFCISFTSNTAKAQEKPEDLTEHFFKLYVEQSSDTAIGYIFANNKWMNNYKAYVDNLKMQTKEFIAKIGQYYGYELIDKVVYSENYILMNYMLRYDRQPIKISFILYKPNLKWQIQNLKLDEKLEDDIELKQKQ